MTSDYCHLWGDPIQITTDPANDCHATWSPDASMIAFESDRNGNIDIWMIEAGSVSSTADLTWGEVKALFR